MRSFSVFFLLIIGYISLAGEKDPREFCKNNSGLVHQIKINNNLVDFCFIDIHSIDLKKNSDAAKAYVLRSSKNLRGGICGSFGAESTKGVLTSGKELYFCRFEDGSLIHETTLWFGPLGPEDPMFLFVKENNQLN